MNLSAFDYNLPENLIAQFPSEKRDFCKLLYVSRKSSQFIDTFFFNISDFLKSGDTLVLNNSRVIPARIRFNTEAAGCEIFIVRKISNSEFECLVRPGKKFKKNYEIKINQNITCRINEITEIGRILSFNSKNTEESIEKQLYAIGEIPLPPYITEFSGDKNLYQTVYSKFEGSTAAPTAGLHFTDQLLIELKNKGINIFEITLHVGPGTFQPVKTEKIEEHKLHSEYFSINEKVYEEILARKKNGGRIIAVGTTTCRTLETVFADLKKPKLSGFSSLFIYPDYDFKIVDAVITNFHLPKSSLLMLTAAFAGYEKIMSAYVHAIKNDYRFFSFGDAMIIS